MASVRIIAHLLRSRGGRPRTVLAGAESVAIAEGAEDVAEGGTGIDEAGPGEVGIQSLDECRKASLPQAGPPCAQSERAA
jgi:hypothetical protein